MILDDPNEKDINAHGLAFEKWNTSLAFMGDCDGPAADFLVDLVAVATPGLRRIFSHCRGFAQETDLLRWMREYEHPPATIYVNRIGRTVKQVHEEDALYNSIESYLDAGCIAVNLGASLAVPDLVRSEQWEEIGRRALLATSIVQSRNADVESDAYVH